MKLIYFSDTHLGFNDLDVINDVDINQREADFYDTCLDKLLMLFFLKNQIMLFMRAFFHCTHPSILSLKNPFSKPCKLSYGDKIVFLAFDEVFRSQDEEQHIRIMWGI